MSDLQRALIHLGLSLGYSDSTGTQNSIQDILRWSPNRFKRVAEEIRANPDLKDHLRGIEGTPYQALVYLLAGFFAGLEADK